VRHKLRHTRGLGRHRRRVFIRLCGQLLQIHLRRARHFLRVQMPGAGKHVVKPRHILRDGLRRDCERLQFVVQRQDARLPGHIARMAGHAARIVGHDARNVRFQSRTGRLEKQSPITASAFPISESGIKRKLKSRL
jgi:hypothetical protein